MEFDEDVLRTLGTALAVGLAIHVTHTDSILIKFLSKLYLKLVAATTSFSSPQGQVTGLFIHPVKSLRPVSLKQTKLDEKGLSGDRRFMVVYPSPKYPNDTTHRFLTQRQCPSLATVVATLVGDDYLVLERGTKSIKISISSSIQKSNKTYDAGIWSDKVSVQDMGDDAAKFLQSVVNGDNTWLSTSTMFKSVRLVSHSASDRPADSKFVPLFARTWMGGSPLVSLSDGFPILIACEASLDELNKKLIENGKEAIPMSRFRPNIVIKGTKAFEEDRWKTISIGNELFAIVKACPRCKQSCTDQQTGEVSVEPVNVMKSFRALGEHGEDVFFAQNAIPLGRGTIRVGDEVKVLQIGDPVYC